jgi:hypothetical protein
LAGDHHAEEVVVTASCHVGVVRADPRGSGYRIEATSPVPVADEMLAYKLLLETDERRFLATAHRFPYR